MDGTKRLEHYGYIRTMVFLLEKKQCLVIVQVNANRIICFDSPRRERGNIDNGPNCFSLQLSSKLFIVTMSLCMKSGREIIFVMTSLGTMSIQ